MEPFGDRIKQKVSEISARVAASEGMEVVGVECKGNPRQWTVRIFIDKPEGISHADCELISGQVGTILDVESIVSENYTLEISSPGLDRKLAKVEDFERFLGRKARLSLRNDRDGQRQFTGRLLGFENHHIVLELNKKRENSVIHIEFDDVENARLVVEL